MTRRITILGDSRVFDTYYASQAYVGRTYGYQDAFPHLLSRHFDRSSELEVDVVHIPDHFRGRTLKNNILRLSLTDPDIVVLCDGIWETLISPKMLSEFGPEISADRLAELYAAGKLELSPHAYAARIAEIVNWFFRRRRIVVWMNIPVPPKDHFDGLHFAGNYRPPAGWHECVGLLNDAVGKAAREAGGRVLDIGSLMDERGGAARCLIDQWHFSREFHRDIARAIAGESTGMLSGPGAPETSSRVMSPGWPEKEPVTLVGESNRRDEFKRANPEVRIESEYSDVEAGLSDRIILMLPAQHDDAFRQVNEALDRAPRSSVVLLPGDLDQFDNFAGSDRSAFGFFK